MWHDVGGNESGFSIPDPVDTDIVWSGGYDGYLDRFDLATGQIRSVDVWPETTTGSKAAPVKYRVPLDVSHCHFAAQSQEGLRR
jgi:hypothetical protein